jgi:DNA replication protein DnaC
MDRLGDLLSVPAGNFPAEERACKVRRWDGTQAGVSCTGVEHLSDRGHVGPCPAWQKHLASERVQSERARLAGVLGRLGCEPSFETFRPDRGTGTRVAFEAMKRFSLRESTGVFLSGPTGVGKTHLLLASHFALLRSGWPSAYVTSAQLRHLFFRLRQVVDAVREEAEKQFRELQSTPFVHLDELGDVVGDERFRGAFAEGIKRLLDESGARFAVTTNLDDRGLVSHPDVGDQVLSRLLAGARKETGEFARILAPDHRISRQ